MYVPAKSIVQYNLSYSTNTKPGYIRNIKQVG